MKYRLLTAMMLSIGMLAPQMAGATYTYPYGGPNDVLVSIAADRHEVLPGNQLCYTVTIRNNTDYLLPLGQLSVYSNATQINFFLVSDGGEIHPGATTWLLGTLPPAGVRTVKMRAQVLGRGGYRMPVTASYFSSAVGTSREAYSSVTVLGRMPQTGVDLSGYYAR